MKDKYSEVRLSKLHPKARPIFMAFLDECESEFGITLRIMEPVVRTIAEQNELYSHGRNGDTRPIVTKAKGGTSFHNFALAIDICEMSSDDNEVLWNFDMGKLDAIAKKYGIEWGGDWHTIKDKPHFELRFGFKEDCSDLLALFNSGKVDKNGFVIF